MIQRIQSVYLLFTAIISSLFLSGGFLEFIGPDGHLITVKFYGIFQSGGDKMMELIHYTLPFAILSLLVPIIALVTIFLFKNRKLQSLLTVIITILEILIILFAGYFILNIVQNQSVIFKSGIKMLFPFICLLLTIMAYKGIQKDDKLVKSYDRLR